jgi:hypothetical protein
MYICVRAYRHWLNQWLDTDRLSVEGSHAQLSHTRGFYD